MFRIPKKRHPVTPGRVLQEDFVEPLKLTQDALAKALGVHRTTVNEILNDKRAVTSDMALRLGHVFRTSPAYWLGLQTAVDLYSAEHSEA
ncbi:addiction module antidote protein, HigA family, partial [bacterium]